MAAKPVYDIHEVMQDPHILERGAFQDNPHPVIGVRRAYASPINIDGVPRTIARGAPLWGEHNGYVCSDLLGLAAADVERLARAGAIR